MSRRAVILALVAALGLAFLWWVLAGRQFVLLIDLFATSPAEALPTDPLVYSPNGIAIGGYSNRVSRSDGNRAEFRVDIAPSGRLVLHSAGHDFPLGIRTTPPDRSGRPDIPFIADPGDRLSFSRSRSLLSWPTPFDFNFMTGSSPTWRRNLYFRLLWTKPDGRKLTMTWRYEQPFYGRDGWSPSWMERGGATGLIELDLASPTGAEPESVAAYLLRSRGWKPDAYRLENRGSSADGRYTVIRVVDPRDTAGAQPGGGASIELSIDRATGRIERELGLQ
ncbi:MAG: hypothetical protein JWO51_4066 [Rhodospirillales bacterium]|nr:hypothetical protein [Rhodospirillales bacterium]